MAEIIIKKKLALEFLGDEYKDSFLVFRSIAIGEYDKLIKEIDAVPEEDNQQATSVMLGVLEKHFVDGLFEGQKVVAEDLRQFDGATINKCFETLTGQSVDEDGNRSLPPKSESPSSSQSKTVATPEK